MEPKTITLGGQDFAVPPLALRQIKVVTVAGQRLNGFNPKALTAQNMDDLAEIAFVAAQKADPTLTRAVFDDMHITTFELLMARPAIVEQAGMTLVEETEPGEQTARP